MAALALTTCMAATAASADGAYFGIGLGYSKAKSVDSAGTNPSSELKSPMIGLTGGYRWDFASGFAAAEVDADVPTDGALKNTTNGNTCPTPGATGSYFCSHSATIRLRGIYGMPIANSWELYGALGLGVMTGQVSNSPGSAVHAVNIGPTVGLGIQHDLGKGKLRFELNYDHLNTNQVTGANAGFGVPHPTYTATTLKASYIFGF
ncbi:outer membrane beta-barrel protein [Aquicoccus sp. G2-2]|uniref:outer membrane beta-barrel protein n=1 Tax=Aquicoccus sp. G2-2 TaxID=3092120 RepID=UPI0036714FE3